jgi:hypothetical protein
MIGAAVATLLLVGTSHFTTVSACDYGCGCGGYGGYGYGYSSYAGYGYNPYPAYAYYAAPYYRPAYAYYPAPYYYQALPAYGYGPSLYAPPAYGYGAGHYAPYARGYYWGGRNVSAPSFAKARPEALAARDVGPARNRQIVPRPLAHPRSITPNATLHARDPRGPTISSGQAKSRVKNTLPAPKQPFEAPRMYRADMSLAKFATPSK